MDYLVRCYINFVLEIKYEFELYPEIGMSALLETRKMFHYSD
jgi:hypothetical protein